MKRLVFILVGFTCTLFTSIAFADVGTDRSSPLPVCTVTAQPAFIFSAEVFTVTQPTTVVCLTLYKQYATSELSATVAKSDTFTWIDPGICIQVSISNSISKVTRTTNNSYTPYLLTTAKYEPSINNCLSTTRHV